MDTFQKFVIRSLVVLVCILISACAKTILLKPDLVGQDCKSDHWRNTFTCGVPACTQLDTMGYACGTPLGYSVPANSILTGQGNSIWIGWDDGYKSGSGPCPCWEAVSTMSHGYVKFDVSPLKSKNILAASLAWRKSTIKSGEKGIATNLPNHVSCVGWLLEAKGPWKSGATPANILYDNLDQEKYPNVQSVDLRNVVDVVKMWISTDKNYGFMLTPKRNWTVKKSNHSCVNNLYDFELFVRYKA